MAPPRRASSLKFFAGYACSFPWSRADVLIYCSISVTAEREAQPQKELGSSVRRGKEVVSKSSVHLKMNRDSMRHLFFIRLSIVKLVEQRYRRIIAIR